MEQPWFQAYPRAHHGVVSVAVCTVVASSEEDTVKSSLPGDDLVQLVPVFGSWVPLRDSVLWFGVEEGIGDAKTVVGAQFQQPLSVVVHLSHTKVTETG